MDALLRQSLRFTSDDIQKFANIDSPKPRIMSIAKFLFFFLTVVCSNILFCHIVRAQPVCGFDDLMQTAIKNQPAYGEAITTANAAWSRHASALRSSRVHSILESESGIIEIPVVIHVMHTGEAIGTKYNPTDAQLTAWINYLNAVYAAAYPGYPQAGNGGVALPVKFTLAKRDSSCNATSGIERIDMSSNATYLNSGLKNGSPGVGISVNELTSAHKWSADGYYNLFVVNKINGEDGYCTGCSFVAGFAYLGVSYPNSGFDGAYMLASVSKAGESTLPHELGHAFGLYHTFNGGDDENCPPSSGNCEEEGDFVCDTDPSLSLLGNCPSDNAINPCTGSVYGLHGVNHNFMGYANCTDVFTQGQAERMLFMLTNYRRLLMRSKGAIPPPQGEISPVAAVCDPSGQAQQSNYNMGPANVFLDSIYSLSRGYGKDYANPDNQYYIDHTNECVLPLQTTMRIGEKYTLSVSTLTNAQKVKAYIDYNNDGSFDPVSEIVMNDGSSNKNVTYQADIIPPATAVQNTPLRMRVIADWYSGQDITPCGQLNYGQAEDFRVMFSPATPLAMDLLAFSGKVVSNNRAVFDWRINPGDPEIQLFVLEKSSDGNNFHPVAKIVRQNHQSDYKATDDAQYESVYYYRIRMRNADGKEVFSKIVKLNFGTSPAQRVKVYPNPVSESVTIESSIPIESVRVMDGVGRTLLHKTAGADNLLKMQINLERLRTGNYIIMITNRNGQTTPQKIIKP